MKDPALEELLLEGLDPNEEVDAIIRLHRRDNIPPRIKVISRFGEIITCRVKRADVPELYLHPFVRSVKATRLFYGDPPEAEDRTLLESWSGGNGAEATPPHSLTGKGVVIGIIDWGCDFAHVDFVNPDGSTRLLALWDQNHAENPHSPLNFDYGKVYSRDQINTALKTTAPYRALGYHPGKAVMHGTHVMGIAASNGRSGQRGIAPAADLVFVHLGTGNTDGRYNLGDSVSILEAIDFIKRVAGERPLVINLSVGKHGGPHDGSTLVELGIDQFLEEHTDTVLCQSTGNYFGSQTHCSALIRPGETETISFITGSTRSRENEVEIWYSGNDEFGITLQKAGSTTRFHCALNDSAIIYNKGKVVGRLYHRRHDPNNGRNHIDIFLYPGAPLGEWVLELEGKKITDGRFHAWIERADSGQSIFSKANIVGTSTTNTICNSNNAIVVGAYDQTDPASAITPFSSSGPTLDGRIKPLFLAPGQQILSARSSPPGAIQGSNQLVPMSGTSMASPYVAGTVALILEGINRKATIHDIRNLLYKACRPVSRPSLAEKLRGGYGIIDLSKLNGAIKWFNDRQSNRGIKEERESTISMEEEDRFHECGTAVPAGEYALETMSPC